MAHTHTHTHTKEDVKYPLHFVFTVCNGEDNAHSACIEYKSCARMFLSRSIARATRRNISKSDQRSEYRIESKKEKGAISHPGFEEKDSL